MSAKEPQPIPERWKDGYNIQGAPEGFKRPAKAPAAPPPPPSWALRK